MSISKEFYERMIAFYRNHSDNAKPTMSNIWGPIFNNHHAGLHSELMSGSVSGVIRELESGYGLMNGISGVAFDTDSGQIILNEQLNKVCACLGIRSIYNPDQPVDVSGVDTKSLLQDIESLLHTKATNEIHWQTPPGSACSYRFPTAAYIVGSMIQYLGSTNRRVIEIGPGFGLVGVILRHAGFLNYVAIDLTIGCAVVAWTMANVLGEQCVGFHGESSINSQFATVVPSQSAFEVQGSFDAVITCDSFPEIPNDKQDQYIAIASSLLSPGKIVYSVNHESTRASQRPIADAISANHSFRVKIRKMFPLRMGYIEEIFERIKQ